MHKLNDTQHTTQQFIKNHKYYLINPLSLSFSASTTDLIMNIFRLAGDMMHVVSIILLIVRLMATKNAVGISIKTQELYLVVFVCRYLDLLTSFYSMYNSVMKVMYISSTAYVIFMVYKTEPFKTEYDRTQDSFLHWQFAVAPCAVLALITVLIQGFDFMEVSESLSQ
jgi:ER lumen protein retaining receptor